MRLTGCHGFCERGPLVLVLPEGILYQHVRVDDVPEIVESTVMRGELVERVLYVDPSSRAAHRTEAEIPFYAHQQRLVLRTTDASTRCRSRTTSRLAGTRLSRGRWRWVPAPVLTKSNGPV